MLNPLCYLHLNHPKNIKLFQVPNSREEWKQIAQDFERKWNFPHCLGAVDGKHVRIIPPPGSGSFFYNYKGYHSMVLMAVVNANYEFIACEFGINGRNSDGGVIECTKFYDNLKNNSLNIPEADHLNNSNKILNYVFIGDEAFALTPNFLKPFSQRELTNQRKIYNYRLSRARRVVENAFGILATRFRIFHTSINLSPENIDTVVMTCCVLHNFLRRKYSTTYTPNSTLDYEDTVEGTLTLGLRVDSTNLLQLDRGHYRNISYDAKMTREEFLNYFNSEGAVSWQNKMCNIN